MSKGQVYNTIGTYQQLSSLVLHLAGSFPFEIQMCSLFADPCLAEPPQAAECLVADPLVALALFAAVFVVVPSAEMNNTLRLVSFSIQPINKGFKCLTTYHGLFRLLLLNDHSDSVNKLSLIIWDESKVRLLVIRVQEY